MVVDHNKIHLYPFFILALRQTTSVFVGELNAVIQTEFPYPKIDPCQF